MEFLWIWFFKSPSYTNKSRSRTTWSQVFNRNWLYSKCCRLRLGTLRLIRICSWIPDFPIQTKIPPNWRVRVPLWIYQLLLRLTSHNSRRFSFVLSLRMECTRATWWLRVLHRRLSNYFKYLKLNLGRWPSLLPPPMDRGWYCVKARVDRLLCQILKVHSRVS